MTTLDRPQLDIAVTSRRLIPQPAYRSGLDYFSSQVLAGEVPAGDWQRWVDWLEEIQTHREVFEDDLSTSPSREVVEVAYRVLNELFQRSAPSPDSGVIGPNGEIVFEYRDDTHAEQIVIFDDLQVDRLTYANGRLVNRVMVSPSIAHGYTT